MSGKQYMHDTDQIISELTAENKRLKSYIRELADYMPYGKSVLTPLSRKEVERVKFIVSEIKDTKGPENIFNQDEINDITGINKKEPECTGCNNKLTKEEIKYYKDTCNDCETIKMNEIECDEDGNNRPKIHIRNGIPYTQDGEQDKGIKYSIWYDIKGDVDFSEDIEVEYLSEFVDLSKALPPNNKEQYRIELDGLMTVKYKEINLPFYKTDTSKGWIHDCIYGHDPHNKILIVKER